MGPCGLIKSKKSVLSGYSNDFNKSVITSVILHIILHL